MRYLTIILAVGFGMLLCWIMLLNPQPVQVRLDGANGMSWLREPVRELRMWEVIFWSVAIGVVIGFLLTWSNGVDRRRRLRDVEANRDVEIVDDDEPDYVVGLSRRK